MLKASSFGMEIFMGVPSLSRLISKGCMNGISSNLSDQSCPGIFHTDNNGRSLGGRIAQRARGEFGSPGGALGPVTTPRGGSWLPAPWSFFNPHFWGWLQCQHQPGIC